MRVLVTGVTGYLGGRIAQGLAAVGHEVRGLVREDPGRWVDRPERAEAAVGDVTDASTVRSAAEGCGAVVHAAAMVQMWARDRKEFARVNVDGLRHVIEAARASRAKLLYISSFIALGPTDGRVFDERTPRATTRFHNDYERTKWAADQLAREAGGDVHLVRLYPGVTYGPGRLTAGNHVVGLILQHARGKLPGLLGKGDRLQCFAYIDDIVRGVVRALEKAPPGSGYILGGENRTALELFEALCAASGIKPPERSIPFAMAEFIGRLERWKAGLLGTEPRLTDEVVRIYRHDWAYSSRLAEDELGYTITPLTEGIARTVVWLRTTGLL